MPFAPSDFFSTVVPLGAAGFRGLDRLAIEDARTERWLSTIQEAKALSQPGMDTLPDPLVTPGVEGVGYCLPGWEVVRQPAPATAALRQLEYRIDDLAHRVDAWPAPAAIALGEQVLDVVPQNISQVTRISFPCSGTHVPEDTMDGTPEKE